MTLSKKRRVCDLCAVEIPAGEPHEALGIGPWDGSSDVPDTFRSHKKCTLQMRAIFDRGIIDRRDGIDCNIFPEALELLRDEMGEEDFNKIGTEEDV